MHIYHIIYTCLRRVMNSKFHPTNKNNVFIKLWLVCSFFSLSLFLVRSRVYRCIAATAEPKPPHKIWLKRCHCRHLVVVVIIIVLSLEYRNVTHLLCFPWYSLIVIIIIFDVCGSIFEILTITYSLFFL